MISTVLVLYLLLLFHYVDWTVIAIARDRNNWSNCYYVAFYLSIFRKRWKSSEIGHVATHKFGGELFQPASNIPTNQSSTWPMWSTILLEQCQIQFYLNYAIYYSTRTMPYPILLRLACNFSATFYKTVAICYCIDRSFSKKKGIVL